MKCEWESSKIGDLGKIITGKTPPTKNQDLWDGNIPFITPRDLQNGKTVLCTERTITSNGIKVMQSVKLPPKSVCVSCIGNIGYVAMTCSECISNQQINSIIVNSNNDADFVYYLMKSLHSTFKNYEGQSTTLSILNKKHFSDIDICIPPLDIQKQIAAILSALDEKIAINREINENLERQAASIFAGWLNTCTDFSTIGDMAHNILDYSPVASEQIRLLNSSDVTEGVFPVVPLVPNKDLKGHFKKRFKFGDILYSEIRPRNHHYGFVLFDASDYIASTRLMVIRAIENKVSPAMLYQYLLLPEVEAEFTLKTESRSGTFPQGNYADMASIQVPYSPTNSQTAVSEILSRIRFAIAQNQFESQRLAELRDALLPKLMSGEIDVSAVQL